MTILFILLVCSANFLVHLLLEDIKEANISLGLQHIPF